MIEITRQLPIKLEGTIFDVETTGLSPRTGELITVGYISGSELHVFQRMPNETEKEFREKLGDLSSLPRPFLAYNKKFEERWLGFEIDEDIMESWRRLAEERRKDGFKVHYNLEELVPTLTGVRFGVEFTSKDVISAWEMASNALKKIMSSSEEKEVNLAFTFLGLGLRLIIAHNIDDLLRALHLHLLNTAWEYIFEPEGLDRDLDNIIHNIIRLLTTQGAE